MNKLDTITIKLSANTLDLIRKDSVSNYRSISKQIAFILDSFYKERQGK